ncbi:hypothetical protein L0222_15855 [bacterium]|nr:hypothetical protein [bacterium]MCI0603124.1 hypothetical protein [bacterium]
MKSSSIRNLSIELAAFDSRPKGKLLMYWKPFIVFSIVLTLFLCPFSCPLSDLPADTPGDCHKSDEENTTLKDCCTGNGVIEKQGISAKFAISILTLSTEVAGSKTSIHQITALHPYFNTVKSTPPLILRI